MKKILFCVLWLGGSQYSIGQTEVASTQTIEGIVAALLTENTVEAGEKIDTSAVANLFHPTARFTVYSEGASETVDLPAFLEMLTDPYYEAGYQEVEISKEIVQAKGMAHVFQRFFGLDSEGEKAAGTNSYQLLFIKDRWWIMNMMWTVDE